MDQCNVLVPVDTCIDLFPPSTLSDPGGYTAPATDRSTGDGCNTVPTPHHTAAPANGTAGTGDAGSPH